MPKLSQYEIDREANIARNKKLLEELELKQAVEELGFEKQKEKSKSKAKPVQSRLKKREPIDLPPPRVTRASARLRDTVDPSLSPAKKRKREAEIEEQRAIEAEARLLEEESMRIAKRPRHDDLDLADITEKYDDDDGVNLVRFLQSIDKDDRRTATDFEELQEIDHEVEDLRQKLRDLKVVARAKVTDDRIYSSVYHPDITKDLIFFGDKKGQLGIWDALAPQTEVDEDGDIVQTGDEGGKVYRIGLHWPHDSKSSISCIKMNPVDSQMMYTSSYDCSIRGVAFESSKSNEIFSTGNAFISSFDLVPTGNEMWLSDSTGCVTHLDLRLSKHNASRFPLSNTKIGCISVNPAYPHYLLSASNDKTLKIWDTRNLRRFSSQLLNEDTEAAATDDSEGTNYITDVDGESMESFLETPDGKRSLRFDWNHNNACSSASWCPRGRGIVSTSYDDKLRLWNYSSDVLKSNEMFPSSRPFAQIGHSCRTGKWVSVFKVQWSPNTDVFPHFTIGNMTNKKGGSSNHSLDIYSAKGDIIAKLFDTKKVTAVQAVTCSHPRIAERAVSGNASGRTVLWGPKSLVEDSEE